MYVSNVCNLEVSADSVGYETDSGRQRSQEYGLGGVSRADPRWPMGQNRESVKAIPPTKLTVVHADGYPEDQCLRFHWERVQLSRGGR